MRFAITIIIVLLLSHIGFAQKGSYFLVQKDLKDYGLGNYNFDITQDSRGMVYMANLKGVVMSDGIDWSLIETPYSVFSLTFDDDNNLYVGGRKEIAVIKQVAKGKQPYQLISKVNQEVFKIVHDKETIYFLSEKTLYIYSIISNKLSSIEKKSGDTFLDLQSFNNNIYITSSESGVHLISGGVLTIPKFEIPDNTIGFRSSADGKIIFYTSNGNYYIKANGQNLYSKFVINDDGYLEQNIVSELTWVNNELLAISTINGGVVFIHSSTGTIDQYMNYENGLLDNEILSLYAGKHNAIWCATPHGVSIIAPHIPFRNFASYKGLSGNIHVVYEFENRVFVGTSVGLFELVKKSNYENIISYKKVTKTEEIEGEEIPKKKKRLFRKRKKIKSPITITRTKTYYKKQVQRQLLSQSFEYEKIKDIDAKIVQLIEYNHKLLIGSLSGIYELEDTGVKRIFDQPIVYMYKPNNYNFLMVSTYNKQVKVLKQSTSVWQETGLLDGLDDFVEQIVQGNNGSMWLCGADSLYRVVLNNANSLDDVEVYPIHNPHWERNYANSYQGKTYFLNTSGYYYYENHSIKKDTTLEKEIGLPVNMILSSQGKLWVNTGHFWYGQGQKLNSSLNFISLFEDPQYISEVGKNNFWVVAGNNQLYKINGEDLGSISRNFELFLEQVQVDSVALPVNELMGDINQQSSLTFKFASPDYTNIYQTEFQYRLAGLSSEWSEWSHTNNEIIFHYLPAGSYKLEVRARDALNNVQNSDTISFNILAPYWKRSWFYLIELLFFGGLMTISVLINRKKHKFSLLSRLLTFLTLIFIVEFVQTIAEAKFETNQSPVINFFIQVAIALSILPVESILRKFIIKKQSGEVEKGAITEKTT